MNKAQSNILKEVGNSFVREGKYEAAVGIYLKALSLNNCCPLIHSNIAFAYYYLQKFDLSIAHARICIDLDPLWFKGYLRLAKATYEKSGPWAAIEVLRAGIQFAADKRELSDFYLELTRNCNTGQPLNQRRSSYGYSSPIFSDSRNRKVTYNRFHRSHRSYRRNLQDIENSTTRKRSVDKRTDNDEVVVVDRNIPHPVIGEVKNCSGREQNSSESNLSFTSTSADINDKKTLESKELVCLDSEAVKEQNSLKSNTESAAVVKKPNSSEFSSSVSSVDINIDKNNSELCTPFNNATVTSHAASKADITRNRSVNNKKMQTNEEKDLNEAKPKTNKPNNSEVIKDDKFLKMVEELTCASQKHSFQKEKLNESLKEGYTTFEKKLYRRAIDCYKEALKIAASTPLKSLGITSSDVAIINYILNLARIESNNYEKIVQAIRDINDSQHLSAVLPALNYLLGKAYCKLNRFKKALEPLQKCEEALHDPCLFTNKFWPSTDIVMQETTKDGLEEYVMELVHLCTMCPEKPTAVCRFNRCTEISSHIIPSDQIYVSDPDFIGYVTVICDEKCNIQYHIQCWKAYKDSFSSCEKIHDKDMLDRPCPTTDCVTTNNVQSKICAIDIYGQDGNLKTQVKTERQLKPTVSKNAKKRKHKQSHSDEKPAEKFHTTAKSKVRKSKKNKNKDASENTTSSASSSSVAVSTPTDSKEEMNKRLTVLEQLREINFGCVIENIWNPCEPYYGRCDEKEKKENMIFIPSELGDEDHTSQYYKDYVFSWFYEVLSKEGPMKVDEVQEQWISGINNDDNDNVFSEVKLVLHDVTDVCDLLLESTRFCLIDDNICLSEQLSETYEEAKTELVESVEFMLSEYQQQQLQPTTQIESGTGDKIKKISETASEPSAANNQDTYISDSSGESDEDEDYDYEDESDDEEEVDEEEEISEEEVLVKQPVEGRVNEVIKTSDNEHCVNGDSDVKKGNIPISETSTSESQSNNNHIPDKSNKESSRSVAVPNALNDDYKVNDTVDKAKTDHHNSVDKGLLEFGNQTEQERVNMMKEMFNMRFNEFVHQDRDQKTKELTEKYEESRKLIEKLTEEKLKLIDQKQHTINKYEQQIAKKEASFLKVKEQLLEQRELAVSQAVEASKQVLQLTQSRDAERVKLESHISELQSKKQAASLSQLEMQFKYCELIFNKHTERKNEKLSELQYFSSFEYLPCHNEAMRLIKNWDDFNDKLSKCKIQFNLLYDRLKSMVETGIDIDINGMLSSLTPTDLIEPDPASIPYETFVNQIIEHSVNNNNNNFQSSVNSKNIATQIGTHTKQAAQAPSIRKKSSEVGASTVKSDIDANENQLTASTRDGSPDSHEDDDDAFVTRSESSDLENISNVTALTRNRNNSTGSDKSKQKFLKKNTQVIKSSSVSKDNEAQDHDATSEKQSKKKKKGKSDKQPQHQEQLEQSQQPCVPIAKQPPPPTTVKPPVLEKAIINSIWGSIDSSQNSLNDTVINDNNNEEWQVCVDRRTLREHSSLAAPAVPAVTKGKSHYVKLMERLKRKFPTRTEKELSTCVKSVRERNNCSLSGLSMDEIEFRVERLLVDKLPKKPVSMGLEKFGESAWGGGVVSSNSNWQGSVDMMEECVICCEDMGLINLTTLECNHPFHTECIRQWLKEKSVCPLCNKFTKMPDEFPAL